MTVRISAELLRANPDLAAPIIASLSDEQAGALLRDWSFLARDEQLPPPGDWAFWIYLAGRGAGKTRTGAEWVRQQIKNGMKRGGLIAPTSADARDVMIEGESGLIAVCQDDDITHDGQHLGKPVYEPSKRRVTWKNGAMVTTFSADEPDRLRGPQHEFIWADELCAWRYDETWDLAMFGLRLGKLPRAFISTTPKPKKIIIELLKNPYTVVTTGTTYSNRANLAKQFFDSVIVKYEGTRLGKQELMGVLLEESDNALWTRAIIDETRLTRIPQGDFWFVRIVVAIDPAVSNNKNSDETGIIVCGLGNDKHGYVLADLSGHYSPGEWAKIAKEAYDKWQADCIVAEGNQGGEMVKHTLQTEDKGLVVRVVRASRGKAARAEPISARFEKGEAHLIGEFPKLEDQLCTWEPLSGEGSPDRLDAMVWGLTACILGKGITNSKKLKGFF